MNDWQRFWERQYQEWTEQFKNYTIDELWEEYYKCLDDRIDHYLKIWLSDEIEKRQKTS